MDASAPPPPPPRPEPAEVTLLLRAVGDRRPGAIDRLFPLVYDELRGIAGAQFRDRPQNLTLQPTALIHEAYLKLVGAEDVAIRDRAHFFALASRVMRQILVDHCRKRLAAKRGGSWVQVSLGGVPGAEEGYALEVMDLDGALERLAALDERKARVVELRFFGGLEVREAAEVIGVSHRTVENDWAFARAWLKRQLSGAGDGPPA